MKRFFKIFGISVAATVLVFALFLGALNLLKFAIYSEYYAMESEICKNPGISDAFICQGIAAVENEGVILVSGYMKDGTRSRIYSKS